ncbi:MAG: aminotransferase class IV [Candidatus Eisenbacteria bacterium]|uniref:Aminotransferase class IV n=1 Tax=Eiseniibacteriota bacterium TaxID=2212470 RepID=A0A956LY36_UNCEI|nr:aminotransferase class IV [Candidatus Eisenbacteria bacterium]
MEPDPTSVATGIAWVVFGGAIVPAQDARVSVLAESFLYGETLFETMRAQRGAPVWFQEHWDRLSSSAAKLEFSLPDASVVEVSIRELLCRCGLKEARVRLTLTRDAMPGWIVTAVPLVPPSGSSPCERGVKVVGWTPDAAPWGGSGIVAKSGAWMALASARRRAARAGAWDALRTDPAGRILEGTASNVFWIRHGVLETPALALGVLPGIIRAKLLAHAADWGLEAREVEEPIRLAEGDGGESFHLPKGVAEAAFRLPERDAEGTIRLPAGEGNRSIRLAEVDEVLLTNSLWDVVPVVQCDELAIGGGRVGPWAERLRAEMLDLSLRSGTRM